MKSYMLEIDILRNSSFYKHFRVSCGLIFEDLGVQLMPRCRLRLCFKAFILDIHAAGGLMHLNRLYITMLCHIDGTSVVHALNQHN